MCTAAAAEAAEACTFGVQESPQTPLITIANLETDFQHEHTNDIPCV